MSEKQFKLSSETVLQYQIMDNDTDLNENEVCDLLNEQQATIEALLLDRDRQEEKLDIARRNLSKQLEKIEELQKKNAELTERLRECRMRLDKFNCR